MLLYYKPILSLEQLQDKGFEVVCFPDTISKIDTKIFTSTLKDREQEIVKFLEFGFTQREIASNYGISQPRISEILKQIKNKFEKFSNVL